MGQLAILGDRDYTLRFPMLIDYLGIAQLVDVLEERLRLLLEERFVKPFEDSIRDLMSKENG